MPTPVSPTQLKPESPRQYNTRSKSASSHSFNPWSKYVSPLYNPLSKQKKAKLQADWELCTDMYEHLINCGVVPDSKMTRDLVTEKREELEIIKNNNFTHEYMCDKIEICDVLIGQFMNRKWLSHLVQFKSRIPVKHRTIFTRL
jgi:hypothetical protein